MALFADFFVLFLNIELPEEVEGYDGVDVHNDCQQHHSQYQLSIGSKSEHCYYQTEIILHRTRCFYFKDIFSKIVLRKSNGFNFDTSNMCLES